MPSVVQEPTPVGALFVNVGPAQNRVAQLIAPSANRYGAVVRTMSINLIPTSGIGGCNIFADTSAPANISDATKRIVTSLNSASAITQVWPKQILLAPGMGLWFGGNQVHQRVSMTYDLLPMTDPEPAPGNTKRGAAANPAPRGSRARELTGRPPVRHYRAARRPA